MDSIFMNSKSNKKSDPNVLMLNFTDKTDLKKKIHMLLCQILGYLYMEKHKKII